MSNEENSYWNGWDHVVDQIIGKYDEEVTIADLGSGKGEIGELLHEAGYWNVDAYDLDMDQLEERKLSYRQTYWTNITKNGLYGKYDILAASGFFGFRETRYKQYSSDAIKDADWKTNPSGWDKLMSNLYEAVKDDGVMIMTVPIGRYWVETKFINSPWWEDITPEGIEDFMGRKESWKNWQGEDINIDFYFATKIMRKKIDVK